MTSNSLHARGGVEDAPPHQVLTRSERQTGPTDPTGSINRRNRNCALPSRAQNPKRDDGAAAISLCLDVFDNRARRNRTPDLGHFALGSTIYTIVV